MRRIRLYNLVEDPTGMGFFGQIPAYHIIPAEQPANTDKAYRAFLKGWKSQQ